MPLKLYRLLRNRSTFILISLICFLLIQLSLYRRRHRVSKLKTRERFLLRQACRLLPADLWPSFLLIVQPQTLVRWHDSLWNLIHRLKSIIRHGSPANRPGVPCNTGNHPHSQTNRSGKSTLGNGADPV
ncbi:MAG: hypothetical protein HS115_06025 [Spirochaetales bacterium]|nr:hypothetical protein [Spirochaetales bacterium]